MNIRQIILILSVLYILILSFGPLAIHLLNLIPEVYFFVIGIPVTLLGLYMSFKFIKEFYQELGKE